MKIAICHDNSQELENLVSMVLRFVKQQNNIGISLFSSGKTLLEDVKAGGAYAVYLLDSLLSDIHETRLEELLRQLDQNSVFICLTNKESCLSIPLKSYDFQYLMKPVNEEKLFTVLKQALKCAKEEREHGAPVRTSDGTVFIPSGQTIYVEQLNRMLHYHLADGSEVISLYTRAPFEKSVAAFLTDPRFVRTHRAFLANVERVKRVEAQSFVMENEIRIPLSRSFADEAKKCYIQFWLNRKKGGLREDI